MTELFFTLQELYMTTEAAKLLKIIGDFERIADHGVNLLESAEEMLNKSVKFTRTADSEIGIISSAVREILDLSLTAFLSDDLKAAYMVEPLEQVIDGLKEKLRTNHIFVCSKVIVRLTPDLYGLIC